MKKSLKEIQGKEKPEQGEEPVEEKAPPVSAGAVDKVIDLAFNPTRDKIREVTMVDRMQGRLFPQLDMINMGRAYILEIAHYRKDKIAYKVLYKKDFPESPNLLEEFIFRSAQWQKSIGGKNLERAIDIALAETEAKAGEDIGDKEAWPEHIRE